MCIILHYIWRITIVQIKGTKVLNSFSGVLFCNYRRNIAVTTVEVVYSLVIYSWCDGSLIGKEVPRSEDDQFIQIWQKFLWLQISLSHMKIFLLCCIHLKWIPSFRPKFLIPKKVIPSLVSKTYYMYLLYMNSHSLAVIRSEIAIRRR
jgi:hypothetical protein